MWEKAQPPGATVSQLTACRILISNPAPDRAERECGGSVASRTRDNLRATGLLEPDLEPMVSGNSGDKRCDTGLLMLRVAAAQRHAALHGHARQNVSVDITRAVRRDHGARNPERKPAEAVVSSASGGVVLDVHRHHILILPTAVPRLEGTVGGYSRERHSRAVSARGPRSARRPGSSSSAPRPGGSSRTRSVPRQSTSASGAPLAARDRLQGAAVLAVAGVDYAVPAGDRGYRDPGRADEERYQRDNHCR